MNRISFRFSLLILISTALGACASGPPMGATPVDPRTAQRHLTASALTSREPSANTEQLLRRLGLYDLFGSKPEQTLTELHGALAPEDSSRLFALAELSYLHGAATGDQSHLLAAAVYAWAYLFPDEPERRPEPFDPRLRLAATIYNRGLAGGLASGNGLDVQLDGRTVALPFGTIEISRATPAFLWSGYELGGFRSATDLRIHGLRNRYRRAGIGAPLAARLAPFDNAVGVPPGAGRIPPGLELPVTALLRIDAARATLASGRMRGVLEVHSQDDVQRLDIAGRSVPLEFETTSTLALMLQESDAWAFEREGFLSGTFRSAALTGSREDGLLFFRPWRRGRIPVVLVHGTASSPVRWAELVNELDNDPQISKRFQIWIFMYNTGNPVALSGALLREALIGAVAEVDPAGHDPALQRMVVIGHSQGGLLTKLTAIDPGTRLWDEVSEVPLEELDVSAETRTLFRRALFVKPLPFVKRLIFISTPHRGSFLNSVRLAGFQPSRWLSGLVKLPVNLIAAGADLLGGADGLAFDRIPTSIDNMTPGNPFLEALAATPIVPGVAAHSIIAVRGNGPPEEGNDGVVEYRSAHIDAVESELVIRSSHSVQGTAEAIEEVRRILLEHAAASSQGKN
ncbi:MAG: hypothetical protein JRH10_09205 [Deltaproteobacteria bacterium]|nr:hypothetical protein [Deltaproteobacteria bacterium]